MDIVERLLSDTLWIYTAILGSVAGAAFLFWFKDTKMALWAVGKFDSFLEYLVLRWGWTWLESDPLAWRKKYPHITNKIDELEDRIQDLEINSHPPVAPGGATELKELIEDINHRLDRLENKK
jgi:hypothetical protein|tara:strand:- start:4436 stop:4804 length:369 start_codon:yes stop_codon:yes gene_type:complete